jgi:hypothetical protein
MTKPFIQIDDLLREMTDDEYAVLLATGWTAEPPVDEETTVEETPVVDDLVEGEQP